ncbi:MAG TPA: polynucleotide adenylyltransferase [Methylomirabilota bacterium]|nr:polynucleotide adenylyltransferase [Methylomirabilota bacterium]
MDRAATLPIPADLREVLETAPELEQAFLAGGCVRDWFLGHTPKDFDIEVFGLTFDRLAKALEPFGRVDLVGRSFGVVKLSRPSGAIYDFSVPRRDSKTAPGHKGFDIVVDANLTPKEAAGRRDFTINSLLHNPRTGETLDFYGGLADLQARVLRHTSAAFPEDPLRVLRGMQFAGRFQLKAAPETLALCQAIAASHHELAVERIREEWCKWAAKAELPSAGLHFLRDSGWIEHYPEIREMIGTPQDPEWHPEGDVFTHTCHCCDAMARLPEWRNADESSRITYMFAILTHDFAKPQTTHRALKRGEWRIVSPGHEQAGGPLAEQFLNRIGVPLAIRERVTPLVMNHMAHFQNPTDHAVRKLSKRLEPENIQSLALVMRADQMGRPPKPPIISQTVQALLRKAEELRVLESAPKPILQGRDLLKLGMPPGPAMGILLSKAYEAQLEGAFHDLSTALLWLEKKPSLDEGSAS